MEKQEPTASTSIDQIMAFSEAWNKLKIVHVGYDGDLESGLESGLGLGLGLALTEMSDTCK